ncbi:hypothetical protein IW261DRAFT_532528 [Armillaria novae-zelandiae]|uniref:DUF6534 domain-containing protein n=1 Tax=Armillaria novae-zelandiae TaxID=153914 RepID=A0AA39U0E5_9AGAR|nr:hypothetical protein IW261DRAFT_532528 [Armillaria novae-zelandiae]
MSSQIPIPVPSLGMTFGVFHICATISAILFGITYTQIVKYYKKYPNDWRVFRYSVAILWILDAFHVVLSTHMIYHYLIDLFGDYGGLYHIVWSFRLQLPTAMAIVIGVQGIYTIRIWKLGRHFHRILSWIVVLTFIVAVGNGIFSVYAVYSVSDFKALSVVERSVWVIHSIPPFSDFIIALSMCYYLHKSRQACGPSNRAPDKLLCIMRLGVISGLATSICSLLILITYLAWPNTLIFFGIDLILPKLYINSLLAILNSRKARKNDT